ncbi:hypothetical protein [Horticoccus sp. 23ND18S-11]|uniref:hypothetical protein n=1 Tax=Horticoccus sp. 23ND18S-11 TaxID=3391832 RepID=UPI0039C9F49C
MSRRVNSARRIAAILLLALWLPALLHCRLEAAGVLFGAGCCDDDHASAAASPESCEGDSCGVAEGEFTSPSSTVIAASAPVLHACLLDVALAWPAPDVSPPPLEGIVEADSAPPEVVRTWVFVSRAAPSPRAPSLR